MKSAAKATPDLICMYTSSEGRLSALLARYAEEMQKRITKITQNP